MRAIQYFFRALSEYQILKFKLKSQFEVLRMNTKIAHSEKLKYLNQRLK
jgi:hypothetical protein